MHERWDGATITSETCHENWRFRSCASENEANHKDEENARQLRLSNLETSVFPCLLSWSEMRLFNVFPEEYQFLFYRSIVSSWIIRSSSIKRRNGKTLFEKFLISAEEIESRICWYYSTIDLMIAGQFVDTGGNYQFIDHMFEMIYCIHESKCSKQVITIIIFHLNWFKLKIKFRMNLFFSTHAKSIFSVFDKYVINSYNDPSLSQKLARAFGGKCLCQSIWFIEKFSVMNCIWIHFTWSKFRILNLFPSLHSINTTSYWSRIRPIRLVQSHSCPIATQMKYYVTMGSQRT